MSTKKQAKEKKAAVHIMLPAPLSLRKLVLSAAIDATHLLKEYEEFVVLKQKKLKTIHYLQREMRAIKTLSKQFNTDYLPDVPHEFHIKKPVAPMEQAPPRAEPKLMPVVKAKPAAPTKPTSEIDKLNAELRDIEAKLGKL